jgi:hypothetical protein
MAFGEMPIESTKPGQLSLYDNVNRCIRARKMIVYSYFKRDGACSNNKGWKCLNLMSSKQKPVAEGDDVNTTLQAFFFGRNGENKLQYKGFCR